jgi:hypothetical protein
MRPHRHTSLALACVALAWVGGCRDRELESRVAALEAQLQEARFSIQDVESSLEGLESALQSGMGEDCEEAEDALVRGIAYTTEAKEHAELVAQHLNR